jgi:glyoxylase-like metal-dependent hydrolase (beta-lactamase superfamily II)/rhodanese-related sulfurtransferase
MKVEQIYTGCLAEAAYYIESNGEAAIIDPLRDPQPYLEKLKENKVELKYVFETHFHADFVSGHIDLAKATGAKIIFGPTAKPSYDIIEAIDGQEFKIGNVTIRVLHTPGHTLESTTYLLLDEEGNMNSIFSGDTLFIGDVGRPDLAVKSDLTQEDLAGMLYESIHTKILPLPDNLIVYPGHGAGSACGKNLSTETTDTLGNQKATNYALDVQLPKEDFIKELTTGILPPPQYFPKNAMMNKEGYEAFSVVKDKGLKPFDAKTFRSVAESTEALILDTRIQSNFLEAHIPGSIFIGIDGNFAPWVGALITDIHQPILIVADEGRIEEVVTRLSRVGYDNAIGYLDGGLESWKTEGLETDSMPSISSEEFEKIYTAELDVLDVRKASEFEAEHLETAENIPLDFINGNMEKIDVDKNYFAHCAGGYRSVIFGSILKSRGLHNVTNIEGGYKQLVETSIPKTNFVCPTTQKNK